MKPEDDIGKEEFLRCLVETHQRLFSFVHSLVRDLHDTDEIVQKTSIVLWKKYDSFDQSRSFLAWACGVARLEVLAFVRQRGKERLCFSAELVESLSEIQEPKSELLQTQEDALADCLSKLPRDDRELVDQVYKQDISISHVARLRQRSTHSIYNSVRRIRKVLFDCVQRSTAQLDEDA